MNARVGKPAPRSAFAPSPTGGTSRRHTYLSLLTSHCSAFFLLSYFILQPSSFSQEPPATSGSNSAPTASAPAQSGTTAGVGTNSSALDYLYNRKPQDGTAAKQAADLAARMKDAGVAQDAIGITQIQDPASNARFQRYLGTAEVEPDRIAAYQQEADRVLDLLRQRKTLDAWKHLLVLAEYRDIDAGISLELANRIESIWNADKTTNGLQNANDALRREIGSATRNADNLSKRVREEQIDYMRRTGQSGRSDNKGSRRGGAPNGGVPMAEDAAGDAGSMAAPSVEGVIGKLQLTEEYLRSLEMKAKIKMNELRAQKLFDQSKQDFADYITTLYESGRFEHVVLAADFWRRVFDQGEYPVAMARQVNASLESAREVSDAIDVFTYKLGRGELVAATQRLQEAFVQNELHPAVLALPRPQKQKVEDFSARINRMKGMIEARDFTALETLIPEIKTLAADFDPTKPNAVVNAVKLESKLRLGKAKLAAQKGDLDAAMQEFKAAAETWPGNPDLQDKALAFFQSQDLQNQSLIEFDRLVAEGNNRGIYEKQLAFAPALRDDSKRQDQMKTALEKIKAAEMALEKANAMRGAGDVFGAWETVELATKDSGSDMKLTLLRAELAGRASEFVAALTKAREAETRGESGFALSWYAVAQRQYPPSRIANDAIERLAKQLLGGTQA